MRYFKERDWTPLVIHEPSDFKHVNTKHKTVLLITNPFGSEETCNSLLYNSWEKRFNLMTKLCKKQNSMIVFDMTNSVLKDIQSKYNIKKILTFDAIKQTIDLTNSDPLTDEIKMKILNNHLTSKNVTLNESTKHKILQSETSGLHFPHCCEQFAMKFSCLYFLSISF